MINKFRAVSGYLERTGMYRKGINKVSRTKYKSLIVHVFVHVSEIQPLQPLTILILLNLISLVR